MAARQTGESACWEGNVRMDLSILNWKEVTENRDGAEQDLCCGKS